MRDAMPDDDTSDRGWWSDLLAPASARDQPASAAADASDIDEPGAGLNILDPRMWEGKLVPERQWWVRDLIPARTVTLVTGDGAAGKSTLLQQLVVASSLGRPWLNLDVTRGPALYLSAEDDEDELHRRFEALRRHYDVSFTDMAGITLVDLVGQDAVLGTLDRQSGRIIPTRLYEALQVLIARRRPKLLVIDALADAFSGLENDRQQARQFIGLLKALCQEHGVTVILIAHPSESGMANGTGKSGNTAWNNSVRSRLYLKSEPGGDVRSLTTMKANYGPSGGKINLVWRNGAFEPVGSDAAARDADHSEARKTFLALLEWHTRASIRVSASRSKTYAPAIFSTHELANEVSKARLEQAMRQLISDGSIETREDGPPSRRRSFLAKTGR